MTNGAESLPKDVCTKYGTLGSLNSREVSRATAVGN